MNTYAHSKVTFTASRGYTQSNSASLTVLTTNYNPNSTYANVAGLRIKSNGLVEAKLVWSSGPNVDIDIYTIDANQGAISYPASLATTTDTNNVQDSHEWTETGITSARKLNALSSYLLGSTEIVDSSRNLTNIVNGTLTGTLDVSGNVSFFDETADAHHSLTLQKRYNKETAIKWARGSDVDAQIRVGDGENLFIDYNHANTGDSVIFRNNSSEVARFNSSGNFGIGTASPASSQKLDVAGKIRASQDITITNGDLIVNTESKGIRMLSANGTEYLVFVNNSGQLVVEEQ
jgi:hypothetical protein